MLLLVRAVDPVVGQTEAAITTNVPRPAGWSSLPEGVAGYVAVRTRKYTTGFPVRSTARKKITISRFPLPPITRFELPEVRYIDNGR